MKPTTMQRNGRRPVIRGALAALAVVLAVGGGVGAYQALRPGQTHVIESSYAFDVTDSGEVARHAHNVFVGRVTGVERVEVPQTTPWTVFRVEVQETIKGDLAGTVLVRQLGGTVGKDVWRVEGEPLLDVGRTYALATTGRGATQTLLAGPVAQQRIDDSESRSRIVADWRRAVR